jgi:hypothetical protein
MFLPENFEEQCRNVIVKNSSNRTGFSDASLYNHGRKSFTDKGSIKQRIVQILGSQLNARLVSPENTDYLNIYGSWKARIRKNEGRPVFFVNNR